MLKIANLVILGIYIIICLLGTFYKHISFGWGLADLFGYLFLYGITIAHITLTLKYLQNSESSYLNLSLIFGILLIVICLKATIFRVGEYAWNGELFFTPCPEEILIKNGKKQRKKIVSMCTMDYFSKVEAQWNGSAMMIEKGELKIPEALNKYIKYPIEKIKIESAYYFQRVEGKNYEKKYEFDLETLQKGKTYSIAGEIVGIEEEIPVFRVKIDSYWKH